MVSAARPLGKPDPSGRRHNPREVPSPEHRALHSRHGNGGLTIHEGSWAYCDGAGANETHRWSPTGGVALESLVRWTMPNGASTKDERPLVRSEEHTSELQSRFDLVCRLLLEKKKVTNIQHIA